MRSTVWLGTACVSLAVVSILLWRDREDERARADALEQRLAVLRQAPDPATGELHSMTPAPMETTAGHSSGITSSAPPAQFFLAPEDIPDAWQANRNRERELLRDPGYFNATRAARQLELAQRLAEYQRLGLGLPPDKAEKLLEYWVDKDMEDLTTERPPNPRTDAKRLAFSEYHEKRQLERDAKLRAALGDAGYEKYQAYMASRPTRNQVMSLGTQLGDGSNALRDDQFEPLVAALYTERAQLEQEIMQYVESKDPGGGVSAAELTRAQEYMAELTAAAHQRMHDNAAGILSPRQLAVLDAMLKRERDLQRARHNVHRLEIQAQQKPD